MKKLLILLLFMFTFLEAKTIEATYKISYGILGELGKAKTTLTLFEDNTYKIEVLAYATGLAKALSSGKKERYESYGIVKNRQLIPQKFVKVSSNKYKYRSKTYTFAHDKKEVTLKRYSKKRYTKHDINMQPIHKWKESESVSKNSYFAHNDLLSLFFNIKELVPSFDKGNIYKLKAIGANKTNGDLDIIIPTGKAYKTLEKSLKTDNIKFIASINQKIFSSSKGELFISLNEEGFCNKAVLKDVLLFGDIRGEMISFEIKES